MTRAPRQVIAEDSRDGVNLETPCPGGTGVPRGCERNRAGPAGWRVDQALRPRFFLIRKRFVTGRNGQATNRYPESSPCGQASECVTTFFNAPQTGALKKGRPEDGKAG